MPPAEYATKAHHRQLDGMMLCARCSDLSHGRMVNAVAGQGGARLRTGLITPAQLREQLSAIREKKALVVKVVDATDFHGSFLNKVRDVVGGNPILLVLTKVDLLPRDTDLDALEDWVYHEATTVRRLTLAGVACVSARKNVGLKRAVGAMFAERKGRDVYVLGAANVGKSTFIRAALKAMREEGNFGVPAKRLPTASAMPGTTLGVIPLRAFEGKGVLYDGANGYLAHVRARQRAYLRERFGMTAAEAAATRKTAFAKASQCYKGLRDLGLDVESQEAFTAYCRAGAETFLKPDAALADCLRAMPYRKVVMTNTSETEGMKALTALGLDASSSDAFEKVYGGIFTAPACKPQREAFEKVFADLGRDVDPRRCVMFEDSMKNVKAAKSFGMTTVFVRTRGESVLDDDVEACCDAVVDEIEFEQLRRQLPELFD